MKPIIVRNRILPFGPYEAMAIWPFIFTKVELKAQTLLHERIHHKQQLELALVGFYLLYALNFLYNLARMHPRPYRAIVFEREAYGNQGNPDYLQERKPYAWKIYLRPDN